MEAESFQSFKEFYGGFYGNRGENLLEVLRKFEFFRLNEILLCL
jgi:hypothetical protein